MSPVSVTSALWRATWLGLRRLSGGHRESACVWGGRRDGDGWHAERVIFFAEGADAGSHYHRTSTAATAEAFRELRSAGLRIVADIHTHPEKWVGLSAIDQEHPVEYRGGLLALVLPDFAAGSPDLGHVGAHLYEGDGRWRELDPLSAVAILPRSTNR